MLNYIVLFFHEFFLYFISILNIFKMSSINTNSVQNIPVVGVWDPRINARSSAQQTYLAQKGCSINTIQSYPPTGLSNSNTSFNTPPPSTKIFLDRLVFYKETFTATIPGDVRNNLGIHLSLRQWPLNSSFQTITNQIDTNQVSGVTADVLHALTRYSTCYRRQSRVNSLTASQSDNFQDYSSWQSPLIGGSSMNSASAYGESPYNTRGSFLPDSTVFDGVNTILTYTCQEPLFLLPPFLSDEKESLGLVNVKNMQWNINFTPSLGARRFSWDGLGVAVPSITVAILSNALILNWLTPPITEFIPDLISYPWYNYIRYTNSDVDVKAGASSTAVSQVLTIREIPQRLYCYLKRSNVELYQPGGYVYTDTFGSIQSVSVTFNNLSNMFATFSRFDLYNMCRRNGLEMTYSQFNDFTGSVLCFDPSVDFGLPSTMSAGVIGEFNLQITINFTNKSVNDVKYTPYYVVVYTGIASIGTGGTTLQTAVLSSSALVNSTDLPQAEYEQIMMYNSGMGGSIFGRLKTFLSGARPYVNKIARAAEFIGDVGQRFDPRLRLLKDIGSTVRGATGGKMMSRKQLKKRAGGLYGAGINNEEIGEIMNV